MERKRGEGAPASNPTTTTTTRGGPKNVAERQQRKQRSGQRGNATKAKTATTTGPQLLLGRFSFGLSFASSCSLSVSFLRFGCLSRQRKTNTKPTTTGTFNRLFSFILQLFQASFRASSCFSRLLFSIFVCFVLFFLEKKNNFVFSCSFFVFHGVSWSFFNLNQ